ncbi:hypothetical protein NCS52_01564700 [Fusarium sp. LHS14.1]|nr:hypothetical protein NCS52_01564700 [Fusarium sp. LHS14.1]
MEYCGPCDQHFGTPKSLKQHLESNVSRHSQTYCSRCLRHFPHAGAKQQHIADSRQHHVCHNCAHKPDFDNQDELDEHLEMEQYIYIRCDHAFSSSKLLTQHGAAVHNGCESCGPYFESLSNLTNHRKPQDFRVSGMPKGFRLRLGNGVAS